MLLLKKITLAVAAITALSSASTISAQSYRLPSEHNRQHNGLIANQRPAGISTETLKLNALQNKKTVEIDPEIADLFNYNFSDQSVAGAYNGLPVPAIQKIDVSGYVAPINGKLTSPFGYRPRFGRMHKGVDINLHVGDTVKSAFDGRIRITRYEGRGYGYYVVVRHDNGLETVYGHLSRFLVKPNQYVKAGEPIALGGNTGRSTGPHLHFETRFMGIAINPESIIDFENRVTHQDIFTFDKTACDKALASGSRKAYTGKARKTRSTASKTRKNRRKK